MFFWKRRCDCAKKTESLSNAVFDNRKELEALKKQFKAMHEFVCSYSEISVKAFDKLERLRIAQETKKYAK